MIPPLWLTRYASRKTHAFPSASEHSASNGETTRHLNKALPAAMCQATAYTAARARADPYTSNMKKNVRQARTSFLAKPARKSGNKVIITWPTLLFVPKPTHYTKPLYWLLKLGNSTTTTDSSKIFPTELESKGQPLWYPGRQGATKTDHYLAIMLQLPNMHTISSTWDVTPGTYKTLYPLLLCTQISFFRSSNFSP